jgi:hypothetical protein
MAILHYSPQDVTISIGGIYLLEGYADGTFVNIVKDVKPYVTMKSMDGNMSRLYNTDSGYQVEITLAQSSQSNDILSAMYNIDIATQIGKFPLFIKDNRGSTTFMALTAWVEDIPTVAFSNSLETRTWVLGCTQATLAIGGNDEQSVAESAAFFGASLLPLLREFGLGL